MFKLSDLDLTVLDQPRPGYLVVLPFVEAKQGLLVDLEESRNLPGQGIVLRTGGEGVSAETGRPIPMHSKPGQLVSYGRYAGMDHHAYGANPDAPIRIYVMRDAEVILHREEGTYDVEFHEDRDLRHLHLKGLICEHCPKADMSAERAKVLEERGQVVDIHSRGNDPLVGDGGWNHLDDNEPEPGALIEQERERLRQERAEREPTPVQEP